MKSAGSPSRRQQLAHAWRLVAVTLIAALLSVLPAVARTADAQTTTCTAATLTELATCLQLYDNASFGVVTIELQADIHIPAAMTIYNTSSARLVFNGNGHSLTRSGSGDIIKHNRGTADYNDLTITGASGDGIEVAFGPVLIQRSTIVGNARGVFVDGPDVRILDSTIHNNTGEGIKLGSDQQVLLFRSTIADNGAAITGGHNTAALLVGSLLARNDGANCVDISVVNETGGNVVDDGSCSPIAATANVASTFDTTLRSNGCSMPCTQTLMLFPGSPATDAYSCAAGFTDQRGEPRPASACDAGAFEASASTPPAFCDGQLVTINLNDPLVTITGTENTDVILGTPGNDVIHAGAGHDVVCAGGGDDTIYGSWGSDRIFGEDGNDTIHGEGNADFLAGGNGNDTIHGGDKSDRIYGDSHNGGPETGRDTLHGDSGSDLFFGGPLDDDIFGGYGADRAYGQGGADAIEGGHGNDKIYGGTGNDVLAGGDDNDRIWGETGHDRIFGQNGDDTWLDGDDHNDEVQGGPGDDIVRGGDGRDKVYGNGGTDDVRAQAGDDLITDGGSGIDSCQVAPGNDAPPLNCEA